MARSKTASYKTCADRLPLGATVKGFRGTRCRCGASVAVAAVDNRAVTAAVGGGRGVNMSRDRAATAAVADADASA